jgi:hypothetical protein
MLSYMYVGLRVKYPLFLWYFSQTWIFSTYFPKILTLSNLMKVRLVGVQLFHAEGDRYDEANSCFSKFCEKCLKRNETIGTLSTHLCEYRTAPTWRGLSQSLIDTINTIKLIYLGSGCVLQSFKRKVFVGHLANYLVYSYKLLKTRRQQKCSDPKEIR